MKDIQCKIINTAYPAAEILWRRFCFEVDSCGFCLEEPETIEHLNSFQVLVYVNGLSKDVTDVKRYYYYG